MSSRAPQVEWLAAEQYDVDPHEYRVFRPGPGSDWMRTIANAYVDMRTECVTPLEEISLEGLTFSAEYLKARMQAASLPPRRMGNFDVVRSDFGEVLSYLILAEQYDTQFGYCSVRDRERMDLPGRGIDIVGIETSDSARLILVLGEVKVSDEQASPPQVVDTSTDCLRQQHLAHLSNRKLTANKLFDQARHVRDSTFRTRLLAAVIAFEDGRWDQVRLVVHCLLVRPAARYTVKDFGSFQSQPDDYAPGRIRYLVVCVPAGIEETVSAWYGMCQEPVAVEEPANKL
jgi:hypothetical protein